MLTQVAYHNRTPSMLDEMKIMLPLSMTESVHLFFTFYHISCQKKMFTGPWLADAVTGSN